MVAPSAGPLPPGPRTLIPGASLFALRRRPLQTLTELARQHGPVARLGGLGIDVFLLSDPDGIRDVCVTHAKSFVKGRGLQVARRLLGEGLVTSEGAFHLRQRRLSQPAFHRDRLVGYGAVMSRLAQQARAGWRDGEVRDAAAEMNKLTLAIVSETLFGSQVDPAESDQIREAINQAIELFNLELMPIIDLLDDLPIGPVVRFKKARQHLDEVLLRMIEARRRSGEDKGDLLSMLLLAQDTEGDGTGMSDAQLRDEAMTLFLAGHETTANALAWTWHLLAQSPEVEARLHAEVDALGRPPALDDLEQLPYTRRVLSESMRLYPPAWTLGRKVLVDYPVLGYTIPAGSIVLMSQWVMHRDPRFWTHPDRFDPERFLPEASAQRPRFAYFPFSAGPRQCIGENFAWAEGILCLAAIAQHWSLRPASTAEVKPEPRITLRPKGGLAMRFHRRGAGAVG
jgi:cytochrome P450